MNKALDRLISTALLFVILSLFQAPACVQGQKVLGERHGSKKNGQLLCPCESCLQAEKLEWIGRQYEERARKRIYEGQARGGGVPPVLDLRIFVDEELTTEGLVGSYVNQSLRNYSLQDDWRISQAISGTRIDTTLDFTNDSWGFRAEVGLTGGSDANWDNFSVQWDGFIEVTQPNMTIRTRSDDGSRMWIDLNLDGNFDESGDELIDNGWGMGQAATFSDLSVPLQVGVYPIRIQYEEAFGGNIMQLLTGPPHVVRIAYLIPANRSPQANGVSNLRWMGLQLQEMFREQMDRNGFGEKTISLETESDGVTPVVHVVPMSANDDFYRADDMGNDGLTIYNRVLEGASNAGVGIFAEGEVWMLIYEGHLQLSDGRVLGGVALGAGFGNGSGGGVGLFSSDRLSLMNEQGISDDRSYNGLVVPEIGPFPLVQDVSYPWFSGSTISSVVSAATGAVFHEVSHGLGLPHDFRNDSNFAGNMMGNGLRGYRGYLFPDRYPNDEFRVAYGHCLRLNSSRYFGAAPTENTPPSILSWSISPTPVNGKLVVNFSTSDDSGLANVILARNGNVEHEMELSGQMVSSTIETPWYSTGESNFFNLTVYDVHGNQQFDSVNITPTAGQNRAPEPFVLIRPTNPRLGSQIIVNGQFSFDRDHSASELLFDWDLDGDGVFDTAQTSSPTLDAGFFFQSPGPESVILRVTDPLGASSVSSPVAIRIGTNMATPDSFNVTRGTYVSGSIDELEFSDNQDLVIRRNSADVLARVFVEIKSTSFVPNPSTFSFTFESAVFARSTVVQSVDLFNYTTDAWEEVDVRNAARFTDSMVVIEPGGDLSRFVESGTNCVEARLRYQSNARRQRYSANIDQVSWTIE